MKYAVLCNKVSRRFGDDFALRGICLSLPRFGMIGILGHSGSGKSTLLNILSGIDHGYKGEVQILMQRIKSMNERKRNQFRLRNIGYVFQNFELLDIESALNNVLLPIDCVNRVSRIRKRKKAADLIRFVGLKDKIKQPVYLMSGGEKQRVAIARALANDPKIILADEPSGALDEQNAEIIFGLLKRISKKALVIVVSHDIALAERYLDESYFLSDGRIIDHKVYQNNVDDKELGSMRLPRKDGRAKPSLRFLFGHSLRMFRAKKIRTLFTEGAIMLGLVGVGLSSYMTSTIQDELSASFASIVPENVITMSPSTTGIQGVSNVYAAKMDEAMSIMEAYPEQVKGVGSSIQIDFESWFTDANMFTFLSGATQQVLPGFSARSINDYLWLEDYAHYTYFPKKPAECDGMDEVVLGLPYASMSNLCFGLHIQRNYESLGRFIEEGHLQLILDLARYEWDFDDSELFTVIAVTQTEFPCFFHSYHDWNKRIFLDHLQFRSWLTSETPNPQYALELPFLSLNCPYEEFIPLIRKRKEYDHLIYECATSELLPTVCPIGKMCSEQRVYLYGGDKFGTDWRQLDEICSSFPSIVGRSPITQGGYYADADSIAMGFSNKFFICDSLEKAHQVVDLYSDLPLADAGLMMQTVEGVVDGSYLSSASGGLRVSADLGGFSSGVPPVGLEEIGLSEALFKKLQEPQEVYVCAEIKSEEVGDMLSRSFATVRLKVTGVKKGKALTMYVNSDWTIDFFQIHLGMSAFMLQPMGAVFYLEYGADPLATKLELRKNYPSFRFGTPKEDVESSMSSTLSYLGVVLGIFSAVAVLMSSLLLLVIMSIQMNENRKEDHMLFVLGLSRSDIGKTYACHCFLYVGIGVLSSSILMLAIEGLARRYIALSFGTEIEAMLSLMPITYIFFTGFGIAMTIVCFLLLGLLRRRDLASSNK